MDLNSILNRFPGRDYILYGGDVDLLKQVQEKGRVLTWYTTKYDDTTTPPQQLFTRFIDNITNLIGNERSDLIMIITGNGYVGGMKSEAFASQFIRRTDFIIFHGYPGFIPTSFIAKQSYMNGCIVARNTDVISVSQELTSVMKPSLSIPVPFDESVFEQMDDLLPYIHLISKIRDTKKDTGVISLPLTDDLPTDVIDINDRDRHRRYDITEWTSACHWEQRKLLLSKIELLTKLSMRSGIEYVLVYIGATHASYIPYLLSLFPSLKIHLWNRPERLDVKETDSIRVLPSEFSDPTREGFFTDVVAQKYRDRYGSSNNIILVSDIGESEIERRWIDIIDPLVSYLKFQTSSTGTYEYLAGNLMTQPWSHVQSTETRLLSYRPYTVTRYDAQNYVQAMSYYNTVTRMRSYNIGKAIGVDLGTSIYMPEDGFCTCHDCAREAQIIGNYMRVSGYPLNMANVKAFIHRNTIGSRSSSESTRSLWTHVPPRIAPSNRYTMVLISNPPSDIKTLQREESNIIYGDIASFDSLRIGEIGDILVIDKFISHESVLNTLQMKKPYQSLIVGYSRSLETLRDIITGERPPVIVNFHTDFDPSKDRGVIGMREYQKFIQSTQYKQSVNDLHGRLLLYVLA